jgi:hypothetical protein
VIRPILNRPAFSEHFPSPVALLQVADRPLRRSRGVPVLFRRGNGTRDIRCGCSPANPRRGLLRPRPGNGADRGRAATGPMDERRGGVHRTARVSSGHAVLRHLLRGDRGDPRRFQCRRVAAPRGGRRSSRKRACGPLRPTRGGRSWRVAAGAGRHRGGRRGRRPAPTCGWYDRQRAHAHEPRGRRRTSPLPARTRATIEHSEAALDELAGVHGVGGRRRGSPQAARLAMPSAPDVVKAEACAALAAFETVGAGSGADAAASLLRGLGDRSRVGSRVRASSPSGNGRCAAHRPRPHQRRDWVAPVHYQQDRRKPREQHPQQTRLRSRVEVARYATLHPTRH